MNLPLLREPDTRRGAAEIATALRREILAGRFEAGERLPPERALATQLDVARGTVRDALTRLAEEGLVEIRPGSGSYVRLASGQAADSAIANARPLELMDARFALEPHLCRLAVLHARPAEIEAMREQLATMEASVADPLAFARADTRFHGQLAECAGNGLLAWVVGQISLVRDHDEWARMRRLTLDAATIGQYNAEHRAIVEAIAAREPERAARAMMVHLESARLSLTRAAAT